VIQKGEVLNMNNLYLVTNKGKFRHLFREEDLEPSFEVNLNPEKVDVESPSDKIGKAIFANKMMK
jgi:hypothetical protein